ncbi:MAG: hypothetical protein ACH255_20625 [Candidatus Thiodiazotropha sp.]
MNKQDFILIENKANKIVELLVQEIDGFSDSEEFLRLDDKDRKTAGIVCGAFANYISRTYSEGIAGPLLEKAFATIETLSSIQDVDVENLVATEILENIYFDEFPELIQKLGNKSKALYDRWLT